MRSPERICEQIPLDQNFFEVCFDSTLKNHGPTCVGLTRCRKERESKIRSLMGEDDFQVDEGILQKQYFDIQRVCFHSNFPLEKQCNLYLSFQKEQSQRAHFSDVSKQVPVENSYKNTYFEKTSRTWILRTNLHYRIRSRIIYIYIIHNIYNFRLWVIAAWCIILFCTYHLYHGTEILLCGQYLWVLLSCSQEKKGKKSWTKINQIFFLFRKVKDLQVFFGICRRCHHK